MNKELRKRAEAVLLMQECGAWTDSQTLNGAIIIAHHDKQFQATSEYWHPYFDELAKMMREKFPQCPCKACAKSSNAEVSRSHD